MINIKDTPEKTDQKAAGAKKAESIADDNDDTSENSPDSSITRSSAQKRPNVDRGLDGGYWSRMTVGEMISDNKPKRTRHSVDRLNISVNLDHYMDELTGNQLNI